MSRKRLSYRGSPVSLKTEYTPVVIRDSAITRSLSLFSFLSFSLVRIFSFSLLLPYLAALVFIDGVGLNISNIAVSVRLVTPSLRRERSYEYFLRLMVCTLLPFL